MTEQYEILSDHAALDRFQRGEEPRLTEEEAPCRNLGVQTYAFSCPFRIQLLARRLSPIEADLLIGECLVGAAWKHLALLLDMRSASGAPPWLTNRMTKARFEFTERAANRNGHHVRASKLKVPRVIPRWLSLQDVIGLGEAIIHGKIHGNAVLAIRGRYAL